MKLLVLGASGRIGRWLVRLAAERGHEVTALVRPAARLGAASRHSGRYETKAPVSHTDPIIRDIRSCDS